MVTQRWKILIALQSNYDQHPVADSKMVHARNTELASLEAQIDSIKKLQLSLKENLPNADNVNREIIHLVTGL